MLHHRAVSFVILWAIVITLVIFQSILGSVVFVASLGLIGLHEFYTFTHVRERLALYVCGMLAGAWLLALPFFQTLHFSCPFIYRGELVIVILLPLILLTCATFAKEAAERSLRFPVLTLFGVLYVPFMLYFLLKILLLGRFDNLVSNFNFVLAAYLVAVTKMTDAGAYLIGFAFGKHKMCPAISPKKTWEGLIGGIAIAIITSVGIVHFFSEPFFSGLHQIRGIHAYVLGLILAVTSVVGDLAESMIKREAGIKNSGECIPGIGGVLDLIDSILFTAPVFFLYLVSVGA